jgi:hypothetical protein
MATVGSSTKSNTESFMRHGPRKAAPEATSIGSLHVTAEPIDAARGPARAIAPMTTSTSTTSGARLSLTSTSAGQLRLNGRVELDAGASERLRDRPVFAPSANLSAI